MGVFSNTFSKGLIQQWTLLNQLLQKFAFWSKDNTANYYASLEDDSPYYSLLEKE